MKKGFYIAASISLLTLLTACTQTSDQSANSIGGMDHSSHLATNSNNASQVTTIWKLSNETPQNQKDEEVTIQVQEAGGKPVYLEMNHEKLMHLIVVNKDLSYFNHIHPTLVGTGLFKITTQFPAGGDYKLIADFVPKATDGVTASKWIKVAGAVPSQQPLTPDTNFTKTVDGKKVTLTVDKLKAGDPVNLTFNVKDAATQQPVTDLQPYLGAIGHVVILSADAETYLHIHPMNDKEAGPDAKFMTIFPTSGIYKVWGQFQHHGKVFVVPFVLNVS